jgi:Domain of unknown function (DUF6457)
MAEWIDSLALALEVQPPTAEETKRLLAASREVAHRAERKATPLSTYMLGLCVGERVSHGADRGVAFEDAIQTMLGLLPEAAADGPSEQTE